MSLQESEWECVKPWIHRSPEIQVFEWADTTKELVTVRGTRASTYNSETYIPQVVLFFCLHSDMDESLESFVTDGAE